MFFFLSPNIVPSFTVTYPRFPMIKWLQRKYEESELAQWLAGLVAEYGPAWVVSAQIVGWFCFFVLWALLIVADVHPSRIADSFQLADDSLWRYYIDVYGVPAAAYVLNRIIFPIRIAMEIVLVRQIHKPVNAVLVFGVYFWDKGRCRWRGG
ncbi:hypothetical protein BCR33DRAFT_767385 [Rhizoclosmatium globosum]|uniref:Uncharacterized protein n=1 Tax=Rhizoclosmatium globosum TaxID=329046 RepID=A0A1Y2C3B4_9FUNG|nr:hypothetical protein BCR33DRAFT_767385 [Rhizoclosmatium globosum]|eukprot:ORY41519.1 hypothetical protein BCR33DRAFT_767385 [Rhizoclosmatium globosum]